jgi:Cu+-exporting ATPase
LARSIVAAVPHHNGDVPTASAVVETPGRGVVGDAGGHRVAVGARSFVVAQFHPGEAQLRALENGDAALRAFVLVDGAPAGAIEFADQVRPRVRDTLKRLGSAGVNRIVLLSGDHAAYVRQVADAVGVSDARGDLLPQDKVAVVAQLKHAGEAVMMVGDGVNDAPALAQATVGIAMGSGADVAMESAGITLIRPDLRGIVRARRLSRATLRNIRQNLFLAFVYNTVGVPLAAGVLYPFVGWQISPIWASAAMTLSSLSVITNALRLRRVEL